jgi:ribosomal protein S18 acetylase RimI-like enzyme
MADMLVIRDGQPPDKGARFAIWAAAYTGQANRNPADVRRLLRGSETTRLVVPDLAGAIVGTLIAAYHGWRGNMYMMALVSAHQRRGVAKALVAEGETWLSSLGAHDRARRQDARLGHGLLGIGGL